MIKKMYGFMDQKTEDVSWIWPTLKRAGYSNDEAGLLAALKENKSKKIVHYAVIGLRRYGQKSSLTALKKLVHYPSRDVRATVVVAIEMLAGSSESKFFGELLNDPDYPDKMYPMVALWEVGNADALPAVKQFAENFIAGKIRSQANSIDPRYMRDYLLKHGSDSPDLIRSLEDRIKKIDYS